MHGGEDVPYWRTTLDTNSQYYNSTNSNWVIPLNDISVPYMNNHTYELDLSWDNNGTDGEVYTWTTSFSAQVIADITAKGQQSINNIDSYINNNYYNKQDIISALPSSTSYQNPTEQSFNNIFTAFYNAFTSTTTQNVRFYFPNSNGQYIDIPADLVTSKIPITILLLIQSFYWFLFSRYIIKDIAQTVHNARSGDILEKSSNDGNIKTELL